MDQGGWEEGEERRERGGEIGEHKGVVEGEGRSERKRVKE